MSAANEVASQSDRIRDAQERGVMTFFEVAAVAGALNTWGASPPNVASRFVGILSPLDDGFGAVVRGAASFGVPDGFVPFVYSPKNAGPGLSTNFGQMQAIARETIDSYVSLEASYTKNNRDFEQNEAALRQELLQIATSYGSRIAKSAEHRSMCALSRARTTGPMRHERRGRSGAAYCFNSKAQTRSFKTRSARFKA